MVAILKRELSSYFNSAVAYVVMAVYFLFSGLFFSMICIENDTSSLSYVFGNMFIIILFIIPIITMKSFSEEKRQRTDQALLTSPTSLFEIVMGKFLGALVLFAICSLIFVVYALVISFFTSPDWAVVLCTVLGLLLLGSALIAIDIFISVLTESMIISAVAGMGVGLLIYMLSNLSSNITVDWIATIVKKIDFLTYYTNFTYGMLNLTDIIFFLSVTGLFLFFTARVLEKRRWS
ncbi:ABC transporter permease [uncultured Ruminococcus sp.]|jgi:ABC-2 type transport system permease protein|uniref:ABC transporter permease n=1 Tax=uncultured Ruminococcus sp. TaxID=165186 RepID=UPI002666D2EC|nr:ABC transporter permease [uncultured Ruminococcus sp.]